IFTTQIPVRVWRQRSAGPFFRVQPTVVHTRSLAGYTIDMHEPSFWKRHPFSAKEFALVGSRKRGVPLPCVTSAYTTPSHAPQRSVTSLRPTTSSPVHVGLPRLRIPQRRSAFFPERSSPFPRR